jgi:hypothetical protein
MVVVSGVVRHAALHALLVRMVRLIAAGTSRQEGDCDALADSHSVAHSRVSPLNRPARQGACRSRRSKLPLPSRNMLASDHAGIGEVANSSTASARLQNGESRGFRPATCARHQFLREHALVLAVVTRSAARPVKMSVSLITLPSSFPYWSII